VVNNLKTIARRAGMTGRELAQHRNVVPETVSRHMTGRVKMSMADAVEYAGILNCSPEEILFDPRTVPLFGYCDENHIVSALSAADGNQLVTFSITTVPEVAAIIKKNGSNAWNNGTIYIIPMSPVKEKHVSIQTYNRLSVMRNEAGAIYFGLVFPEPGGTFTVSHPLRPGHVEQGVELQWATPVLLQTYQNEMLGVEIIDG